MGKLDRVADGLRQIGEELLHLLRRFQVALGVAGEQASGSGERFVVADSSEGITEFTSFRNDIVHAIGRE